jgi:hypothetical protein
MLYVEAVMDVRPWQYWTPDDRPYDGIAEIVSLTENVISRHPRHPLALHLYIHLVESTSTPERAESAADALVGLMPGAGHIVHMPSPRPLPAGLLPAQHPFPVVRGNRRRPERESHQRGAEGVGPDR